MARRATPARSISADEQAALDVAKRASTLQLLFRAARLLDETAVARVRSDPAAAAMRTAHTALLPHLDFTGIRLTELAARVGVSKQAVAPLIDELEAMGTVERVADPDDGRAKRIRLSKRGAAAIHHGLSVLATVEAELAAAVGKPRMDDLHRALTAVLAAIDGGAVTRP
jgi:DNA-binding MarR family transcriptional regulator